MMNKANRKLLKLAQQESMRGRLTRHRKRNLYIESLEARLLYAGDTVSGIGLLGQYYNNADLTDFALVRTDPSIAFNWGAGSPDTLIANDTFSVRWSGQVEAVDSETYTFHLNSDNGVRLSVNGQLLIDRWTEMPVVNAAESISLISGRKYDVLIEYFESTGNASIQWEWSSPSQPKQAVPTVRLFPSERGNVLREVWTGVAGGSVSSLTGLTTFPNSPTSVSLNSGLQSPANQADNFGERLRGYVYPPATGAYTFYVAGDETAELWLSNSSDPTNKRLLASVPSATLVNEWTKFPSQRSVAIKLVAGQSYFIELLHKESSGTDHVSVAWTVPGSTNIEPISSTFLSPVLPKVSLFAERPTTAEGANDPARARILRSGAPINNSLTVFYSVRGTAINGTDYTILPLSAVIPAGQDSIWIDLQPINDSQVEGNEIATIEIVDGPGYLLGTISQRNATLTLQDNIAAPAGGSSLLAGTALANFIAFPLSVAFSEFTDPLLGPAIQAVISTVPANPWESQLRQRINVPISAGDVMLAEFYARSPVGSGIVSAILELDAIPFSKSLEQSFGLSTGWAKVQLPFIASQSFEADKAAFAFHLGAKQQTVQFAQISVRNYGQPSTLATTNKFEIYNEAGPFGSLERFSATGQPFTDAIRIITQTKPPQPWHFQATAKNAVAVLNGDQMRLEFWARATAGANPVMQAVVQQAIPPWTTLGFQTINLTASWQKFTLNATANVLHSVNGLQVSLNAGFDPQTIEIGGISWRNLTRGIDVALMPKQLPVASYEGRIGNDLWRTDADNRIVANRMASLDVQVRDAFGNLVDGAVVNIRQSEHAFKFGSAITGYDNRLAANGSTESLKYQSEIKRLFNTVVLENNLKWIDFSANRQLGIDAANWAVANGLTLRGHNVIWPSRTYMPKSVWDEYDRLGQNTTAATNYLRSTINARIQDAAETFKNKVWEWDIVNEPYQNNDAISALGNNELLEWFRLFRTFDPNARRTLNEYNIFSRNGTNSDFRANFDSWLTQLTTQNLIETIGEQSHYVESNLTDISVLGSLIQSYGSRFNRPIAITEFDIISDNRQLQADYLRDYLTMAYSQSGISEFVHWGFWNGAHYSPGAALYNQDFSIRPNGQVYEDLVYGDWWSDVRGTTRSGEFSAKVSKGDYDVTVTIGNQSVTKSLKGLSGNAFFSFTVPGVQIIVPMYEYPLASQVVLNPWWQQVLAGATAATPLTIIANPQSGPMLSTHLNYPDWIAGLTLLRQNPNIRILGYVSTRVAPTSPLVRPAAEILGNVGLYGSLYKHPTTGASLIDGIFLDEMSNLVENVGVYATVAAGIRSNIGLAGRTIVANPGSAIPLAYLDRNTADIFIDREGTPNDLLSHAVSSYVASPAYSQLGFGAIIHQAIGPPVYAQILREIKLRRYDYLFITDDIDDPNITTDSPYDRAPTYFNDLLRDVHAPYISPATFSLPENSANGTVVGTTVSGDPDAGQRLTYSIVSGNTNNAFAVDSAGRLLVNNTAVLDFEATQVFNLQVRVTDNGVPALSDSVTVTVGLIDVIEAPSKVDSVIFGDGTAQRSMTSSITVDFNTVVAIANNAFSLERRNDVAGTWGLIPTSQLSIGVSTSVFNSSTQTRAMLTFIGSEIIGNSLADGNYRLKILAGLVTANGQQLDGDANGTSGGDFVRGTLATDNFFRLFGDTDGDGSISIFDFNRFRSTSGLSAGQANYDARFDYDGSGSISVFDFNQYRNRSGRNRNF